jgi:hypothetical protein
VVGGGDVVVVVGAGADVVVVVGAGADVVVVPDGGRLVVVVGAVGDFVVVFVVVFTGEVVVVPKNGDVVVVVCLCAVFRVPVKWSIMVATEGDLEPFDLSLFTVGVVAIAVSTVEVECSDRLRKLSSEELMATAGGVSAPCANVVVATVGSVVEADASILATAKKTQEVTASVKSLGIRCVV